VLLASLSTLLAPTSALAWGTSSMEVDGTFTTEVVPCDSLCTASEYEGDLEGTTEFTLISLEVTSNPEVSRYTGSLILHTADGDLIGEDVGYWNTTTGRYIDLYTISGGTDVYEDAVGVLVLWGTLDPLTGTGSSQYRGWIVWPTCGD
jgi:hypothetical protein